jgi:HD-like signal output (HDOD) protein
MTSPAAALTVVPDVNDDAHPLLAGLIEELEQLPPSRAAALRVVQVVDDPDTSAADVAKAAGADPALTARILRVANSAYYGLSGRVGTPSFAVTVVGFQTVRSLAAVAAAGLAGEDDLPAGFWERAASVASACSLLARRVGTPAPEAFCTGLLYDLGSALLRRHDRTTYDALAAEAEGGPVSMSELLRRTYGASAATLCADVLDGWRFPEDLCFAIRHQDDDPANARDPLLRALQASISLASLPTPAWPDGSREAATFANAQIRPNEVADLVRQAAEAAEALAAAFSA